MITPADEYLTHQTPFTFDSVFTSDRNFYDRYFFNGYSRDGSVYFALAMGAYPNRGVFDAAFSVVFEGIQYCVRASRALDGDRLDSAAGPIRVEVIEPLRRGHVTVAANDARILADVTWAARSLPNEEPHFFRRAGNSVAMDYTRMTQHVAWSGSLTVAGRTFDLGEVAWWGSRDHSWGIRRVGEPQGGRPATGTPQFFWNWAPANFDDLCTLYTISEDAAGVPWHQAGVILTPYPDALESHCAVAHDLVYKPGTRHIQSARITLSPATGEPLVLTYRPLYQFLMQGLGYGHPTWGHGMWVGPNETSAESYDLAAVDPSRHLHVQAVCEVEAGERRGIGVFEIIAAGPHAPSGFRSLTDSA